MVKYSIRRQTKVIVIMLAAMFVWVGQSLVMAQTAIPTAEVEIVGTVSALTTQTLTLGTQTFDISRAEVKAGVATGKLVKIHASQNPTGQWIALEVELAQAAVQTPSPQTTQEPTPHDEFEITGQITDINDASIIIAGQVIDISNAEIKNALVLNGLVKVHVSIVDGVWVAREVETATNRPNVNGTPVATLQGNDGGHGQDDGAGHDLNDDHGGNNGNNATDDHGGNDANDDHGNNGENNGSDDNGGNSGHGGGGDDSSGGHGHG